MRLVLLGVRVVRVVRRDERDVSAPRQLDELRMEPALIVDPVLLDLDEEVPVAEDGPLSVCGFRGSLLITLSQPLQDLPAPGRPMCR